MAEAAQINRTV